MPKIAKVLSAIEIKRLADRKVSSNAFFAVGGVPGLLLQVTPSGATSWLLRKRLGGKRKSIGLGSYPAVDLKTARASAREQLQLISSGIDPIEKKASDALELRRRAERRVTFEQLARSIHRRYVESGKWKNAKHGQQWINTVSTYAFPVIGQMAVEDINRDDVLKVLEPIWNVKHETATRVRSRLHDVFETAESDGLRLPPNPASKAQLKTRLITSAKSTEEHHYPHLPYEDLPRFMSHLRESTSKSAKVLEFLILTNVRTDGVVNARWSEIDLDRKVWVVPVERNKSQSKPHEAALSDAAIKLLNSLERNHDLVFPSDKGQPQADPCRVMIRNMQAQVERKYVDPTELHANGEPRGITPHGFRSTFKTFMEERTNFDSMVIERCMQHKPLNPLDKNYMRTSMLQARLEAMNVWAGWCELGG